MLAPEALGRAATELGVPKPDDLRASIGYGKLSARHVLSRLAPADVLRERTNGRPADVPPERVPPPPGDDAIKASGCDDLLVSRAGCCNPIRGEPIVGYVTRGKGVSVHASTCPNVVNLLYHPERRIDVAWDTAGDDPGAFTVCLTIQVQDRRGMLADVTTRIADKNTNIRRVEAGVNETRHGRISVTMDVDDLKHLQRVIKEVRAVPGVIDVERVLRQP